MKITRLFAVLGVAIIVAGAMAQGGQGGGQGRGGGGQRGGGAGFGGQRGGMMGMQGGMQSPVMLLNREDVQADLKLTDEQKTKLTAVRDGMQQKMRDAFQGLNGGGGRPDPAEMQKVMQKVNDEITKEVNTILTPAQQTRIKQISVQMSGARIVYNADVQKELGITSEQKTKLDDLQTKQREANQSLMQKMRDGELDRDQLREKMEGNNKVLDDEINKVLTAEQKAKLTAMAGPKFERKDS